MQRPELKLVYKKTLSPKVYFLVFQSDIDIDYIPGQFLNLKLEEKTIRPYSISYVGKVPPNFNEKTKQLPNLTVGDYISFMISTRPDGDASKIVNQIEEGTVISAIGPSGRFKLSQNSRNKVFVATGTGLAPFVPMIKQALDNDPKTKIDIFFGCWNMGDNFSSMFFENDQIENLNIYVVAEDLEGHEESKYIKEGRVTTLIPEIIESIPETDFYLCGHPGMIGAMEKVLIDNNCPAENIIKEKFGK